jgi:hypothetical protein
MTLVRLTLRDAWRGGVAAEDYESHMAAIGQAEANAGHLAGFAGLVAGRLLIAGAGPGQFFDYLEPQALEGCRAVFTDINPLFLTALRRRCPGAICVADDLESTSLLGGFDGACATLVLEHTEWRTVVRNLVRLAPLVMIVIQVNPPEMATAVSPGRTPPGSMRAFKEVHPHLIDEAELREEFGRHGARLTHRLDRPVADGKTMRALTFQQG